VLKALAPSHTDLDVRTNFSRFFPHTDNATATNTRHTYPENLNIFNSGAVATLSIGFIRVAAIAAFIYGGSIIPSVATDPGAPWWMLPTVITISIVPLLGTAAFGGYVNHVNVILPSTARRSKQDLLRWAARPPPETRLQIKSMWFMPWPSTKTVFLGDLRRLELSRFRLANLEHIPPAWKRIRDSEKETLQSWLARVFMGRYWASRQQVMDRSRAPGVWDRMWEQIPLVGEEGKTGKGDEKVGYAISNRTSRTPVPPVGNAPAPEIANTARPLLKQAPEVEEVPHAPATTVRKPVSPSPFAEERVVAREEEVPHAPGTASENVASPSPLTEEKRTPHVKEMTDAPVTATRRAAKSSPFAEEKRTPREERAPLAEGNAAPSASTVAGGTTASTVPFAEEKNTSQVEGMPYTPTPASRGTATPSPLAEEKRTPYEESTTNAVPTTISPELSHCYAYLPRGKSLQHYGRVQEQIQQHLNGLLQQSSKGSSDDHVPRPTVELTYFPEQKLRDATEPSEAMIAFSWPQGLLVPKLEREFGFKLTISSS